MDPDTLNTTNIMLFMKENGLSSEDVMLILKHHVDDLQFEKELGSIYSEEDWDEWTDGDME